jgi:two-component system sensor histidine kinase HydH
VNLHLQRVSNMILNGPQGRPRRRQFRLVKFFALASFLVLTFFSFPFSVFVSQKAKDILTRSYENYALLLGQNLNYQVYQNFVVPVTRMFGKIRLREDQQSEWMDRVVKNTIHSFRIDLVNIYDIGKDIIAYSTDPRLLGKEVKETLGFKKAVSGETFSGLITSGDLWGLGIDLLGSQKKLRTYIPFTGVTPFSDEKGPILGVFEIIQDLSKEYESIVRLQYFIFALSIFVMGLIFFALLLIVQKAEKIIEERARERFELEAQLNQAERLAALGQMVAGVSHEIRNPLGIIQSTAELLSSMPDSSAVQQKLSGVIIEESRRLNNVVTEFLDFARPQEPSLQPCRLEEVIAKNLFHLGPELDKQGIKVYHQLEGRSSEVKADHEMLYRAFLNVFLNSLQAMKEGGVLRVKIEEDRDAYVVAVEDSGKGISEENMKKIFNPFFTTKDRGSGLGLSIVKKIMEGHGGSIWLTSNEGVGTRVMMKFPKSL